jgi:Leucine-rich repeat (LRR) protein
MIPNIEFNELEELNLNDNEIEFIDGIENFKNLNTLYLNNNSLFFYLIFIGISFISNLLKHENLTNIDISNNLKKFKFDDLVISFPNLKKF